MSTHLDNLAEYEQAIEQAKQLEAKRERELAERTRTLTRLHAERLQHERDVGGGGERDPDAEGRFAELLDPDVREVRQTHGTAWIDRRAEARLAGAREAHEQAVATRDAFCAQYLPMLEAELAEGMDDDQQRVLDAVAELGRLLEPLRRREGRATHLRFRAGVSATEDFVPHYYDGFEELARVLARVERLAGATVEEAAA